jgi:hypothetical protein
MKIDTRARTVIDAEEAEARAKGLPTVNFGNIAETIRQLGGDPDAQPVLTLNDLLILRQLGKAMGWMRDDVEQAFVHLKGKLEELEERAAEIASELSVAKIAARGKR